MGAMATVDFWLMFVPKVVLFTYTQCCVLFRGPLLHRALGYVHAAATSGRLSMVAMPLSSARPP